MSDIQYFTFEEMLERIVDSLNEGDIEEARHQVMIIFPKNYGGKYFVESQIVKERIRRLEFGDEE